MTTLTTLLLGLFAAVLVGGCTQSRTVTITATPPDAIISINGTPRGRGPITQQFAFSDAGTDTDR